MREIKYNLNINLTNNIFMKATWNNQIIAESDETILIEGNQYFPVATVKKGFYTDSDYTTECHWKGTAHYFNVVVAGEVNENAAWYYPQPKEGSVERVGHEFANYVAFWKGVALCD